MKPCVNLFMFVSLCLSTLFLSGMEGCETEEAPVVFVSAIPSDGSTLQEDTTIVVVFDAPPRGLDVNVSGGTFSLSGSSVTIRGPFAPGGLSVVVTWSDGVRVLSYTVEDPEPEITIDNFDDSFNGAALENPNWQWRNEPDDWNIEVDSGTLFISAENNRDIWASDNTHFLYQKTRTDTFDVETRFWTYWNTSSGVNGLVVKSPADNDWVVLKFWGRDARWQGQVQFQARQRGLAADPAWRPTWTPGSSRTELFFRLRKDGNSYTGFYKTRGDQDWIHIGTANVLLTPPLQLGIYAGVAAGTGWLDTYYDYFRSR